MSAFVIPVLTTIVIIALFIQYNNPPLRCIQVIRILYIINTLSLLCSCFIYYYDNYLPESHLSAIALSMFRIGAFVFGVTFVLRVFYDAGVKT